MAFDATKFKAGQNLTCTIARVPKAAASITTLERLMRLDPANKRALRRAQRMRGQRILVYIRGNREWTSREKPARVVRVEKGASWTLPYTVELGRELASLGTCLTIQSSK